MLIKRIEGANILMGAPQDWDGKDMACVGLPVKLVTTPEGGFYQSAWEPTPEELKRLNKGASVILWVRGPGHPVVALEVGETS